MKGRVGFLLAAVAQAANQDAAQSASALNKVISLLTNILNENKQAKHNEEVSFAKTQAWFEGYVDDANKRIDELNKGIDNADGTKEEALASAGAAQEEVETAQSELGAAQMNLAEEQKEQKEHAAECQASLVDHDETLDALGRALTMLQASQGQNAASLLETLPEGPKNAITAFLQDPTQNAAYSYESQSGDIVKMVQDFQSEFEEKRQTRATECQNLRNNHMLEIQDLTEEISNLNAKISQEKRIKAESEARAGKAAGKAAKLRQELANSQQGLKDVTLKHDHKTDTYTNNQKVRGDEIAALDAGVAILNKANGAFMQMGSKTIHKIANSLVQTNSRTLFQGPNQERIMGLLMKASKISETAGKDLELITQQVRSGSAFDQVTDLIRNLVERLIEQGRSEETHEGWCVNNQGTMDKKIDHANANLQRDQTTLERAHNDQAQSAREMNRLQKAMQKSEASYVEATNQRLEDKAEFDEFAAAKTTFIQALVDATKVINDMMSAQPNVMLQAEDSVLTQMMMNQPADFEAYGGSGKTSNVMQILETITTDEQVSFDRAKTDEATAQSDYKKMKNDYEVALAANEVNLQNQKTINASSMKTALESEAAIKNDIKINKNYAEEKQNLNKACLPKVVSHEERAAQRQAEIDTLNTVMSVLKDA